MRNRFEQHTFFAPDGSYVGRYNPALLRDEVKEKGYGAKLARRVEQSMNESQLRIVGGINDAKQAKAPILLPTLPSYPVFSDNLQAAEFNARFPHALEAFLGNGSFPQATYIDEIGGEELDQVSLLAVRVAQGEKPKIAIRVVFGATDTLPLRSISYITPALLYAEKMHELTGIEPQVQVITPVHMSSTLSNLDLQASAQQAQRFAELGKYYVGEYFQNHAKNTVFLQDRRYSEELGQEIRSIAQKVHTHVSDEGLLGLASKGEKRGVDTYALYAAAHVVIHDASSHELLQPVFGEEVLEDPSLIISIGGKQEEIFYKTRHQVKHAAGERYNTTQTLQYFTGHHTPPYLPDLRGDITVDDVIRMSPQELGELMRKIEKPNGSELAIGPAARHDLAFASAVSKKRGTDLVTFLKGELK